jgi:hypothetical protein
MEKKLRVRYSNFKSNLSYNEWCKMYNVSSHYVKPTQYYQGNVTRDSVLFQSVDSLYPEVSFKDKIINKFKIKLKTKWLEKTN